MNLKQLEYFVSVAETLNFTKAAQKCFISQTAMTQQIKALEETVGVALFIRDKHHVELTAAGRIYLSEVKNILMLSGEAIKLARTASEGAHGSITIGFMRGYEQSFFSETIRGFHESHPHISIQFIRDNMSALYESLEKGECDVAFNLSSYTQEYKELRHHFLKTYPIMAVFYPGHPLANRTSLTYRDLKDEDFIIMQPKGRPNDEAEEVILCYNRGGFVPNIVAREREPETVLFMVSAALGIAILPEYAVRYFHHTKNLKLVPILKEDGTEETLNFEISWLADNKNPSIGKLLNWMKARSITE